MADQIFRKASLERLSSPEQLDQLMQVTKPLKWLSLLACFIIIGVAACWGWWGEIFTKVHGQGILMTSGSVYDVVSLGAGRVEDLNVEAGDTVRAGQVLAVLAQPELEQQIQEVKEELKNLNAERNLVRSLDLKTIDLKKKYLAEKRRALEESIGFNEQRAKFLAKQAENIKGLIEKKILTPIQYEEAVKEQNNTLHEVMKLKSELKNLSAQETELDSQREKDLITVEYRISQSKEKLKALREKFDLQSRVVSPHAGRVLEIFKDAGKVIGIGEPLLSLEIGHEGSDPPSCVLYFPSVEGKKLRTGMSVHVSPSVVKKETYGYVLAEISEVSSFPASSKGMMRVLQNEDLVRSLAMGGAPIMAKAKLLSDTNTFSGYRWSSGQGPPLKIQSGNLCAASVVVDRQRPIELVLPYLKRHILGVGEEYGRN
ncbi:MAG: NHLP bacteriocin system secretion protein [Desulfobacteraceae bacterium]|nr:MAG: NHLP bacteriocin system secretion protein [Desulfobacteraceae bacterium]